MMTASRRLTDYTNKCPYFEQDDDGKQERVMRQRKKFLSVLMSDGRAKSSNISSKNINTTSNTNRLDTSRHDFKPDVGSLKRTESSAHQRTNHYATNKLDADSQLPASKDSVHKGPVCYYKLLGLEVK